MGVPLDAHVPHGAANASQFQARVTVVVDVIVCPVNVEPHAILAMTANMLEDVTRVQVGGVSGANQEVFWPVLLADVPIEIRVPRCAEDVSEFQAGVVVVEGVIVCLVNVEHHAILAETANMLELVIGVGLGGVSETD